MRTTWSLSFAAVIAVLVSTIPLLVPAQDVERRQQFEGTWRLDHTPEEGGRILDAAADRAASAMNYFIRSIARGRLREGTHLNRRIVLRFEEGDRIFVQFDGRDSYTTRIGRTERRRGEDGEEMRVTQRFRDNGSLEQVFETDSGTRWYVYTPLPDGRMRVETTTGSPRMPQPMYFTLDYRRD